MSGPSLGLSLRADLSVSMLGTYSEEASHHGSGRMNMRCRCPLCPVNNIEESLIVFSIKKGLVESAVTYDTSGEFGQGARISGIPTTLTTAFRLFDYADFPQQIIKFHPPCGFVLPGTLTALLVTVFTTRVPQYLGRRISDNSPFESPLHLVFNRRVGSRTLALVPDGIHPHPECLSI